jgi:hypothetical protein
MQGVPATDVAILGVPGLLLGLLFGYIFGGMSSLSFNYRIGLGFIVSLFGGFITGLLFLWEPLSTFLTFPVELSELIFIILSYFGGYVMGVVSNWAPLPDKPPKRHIIFELDDDNEFDREIEEAMGNDFEANNS